LSLPLREITTAGEQLKITAEISLLFEKLSRCRLFNHYGPSETHAATAWALPSDSTNWPELPPIGEAIDNTEIYLLDHMMNLVPIGVTGEVFIGGHGLARGYLNEPAMTAERFIPDPYASAPGFRLYATGDRSRYREGSVIEFLGRSDHQLKIRGYRVEPAEIETLMRQCGWIKQVVVIGRESASGEKSLAAYFVVQEDSQPDMPELKAVLKRRLPDYMIPGSFTQLDALPLTGSGKVNRRALPAPVAADSLDVRLSRPFLNMIEEIVSEAFCAVLGIDCRSRDQSFFEEGGNSLTATKVVARLRAQFNADIPLRKIFESPTVSGLAACIEEELRGGASARPQAIGRFERDATAPLSFSQERIWFLTALAPASPAYNISGAIQITGPLDVGCLGRTINAI
ncbi:MAG: phosphopantetheine-binding protein, partial [Blastocatellia bacterium]